MQYKVPQFIDIEDKVFGPLTFKQFAYLAGGAGFVYLSFKILPLLIGLVVAPVFAGLALALAFFRYNEKPFIHLMESFAKFYLRSRLYLWHKQTVVESNKNIMKSAPDRERIKTSKLNTMSWSIDIGDHKK